MTLRMRVLPRFPAKISGISGISTYRDGPDIVIQSDYGSLVRIPAVADEATSFIKVWSEDDDSYSIMSFDDVIAAIGDLSDFMEVSTYDPQGIAADAFARANHTGVQAISTVTGLQAGLDAKASLTGTETLTNKTLTAPVINSPSGLFIQGKLYGLTLSNNVADATNDIDIATGSAASDAATPVLITLASALTKRLDAAWAVGTNQGGLDTGSIANTAYHVWLIQRSDTGVVDVLFSASATSPTMPTNYDRKRRIGSIIRESAAIVAFKQDGNLFRRAAKTDRSSTAAQASILLTLSVPTGINVYPLLNYDMSTSAVSTDAQLLLGGAWEGSAANVIDRVFTTSLANVASVTHGSIASIYQTNTSAQVYFATTIASGSLGANTLSTIGWIDNRGTV